MLSLRKQQVWIVIRVTRQNFGLLTHASDLRLKIVPSQVLILTKKDPDPTEVPETIIIKRLPFILDAEGLLLLLLRLRLEDV